MSVKKNVLLGGMIMLAAAIALALVISGCGKDAGGSQENSSSAIDMGYETAIEEYFRALVEKDIEKTVDLMVIETRLGDFPEDKQALRERLETETMELDITEASYEITSAELSSASDLFGAMGGFVPFETQALVLVEGVATMRVAGVLLLEEYPLMLMKVKGRWYVIPELE